MSALSEVIVQQNVTYKQLGRCLSVVQKVRGNVFRSVLIGQSDVMRRGGDTWRDLQCQSDTTSNHHSLFFGWSWNQLHITLMSLCQIAVLYCIYIQGLVSPNRCCLFNISSLLLMLVTLQLSLLTKILSPNSRRSISRSSHLTHFQLNPVFQDQLASFEGFKMQILLPGFICD